MARNKQPKPRDKVVKQGANPADAKQVRVQEQDYRQQEVRWSFALFDPEFELRVNAQSHDSFLDVGSWMKSAEGRTWAQIEANRKRDHPVPTSGLVPGAQRRLRELKQDDVDELWRLRFSGTRRIWGIRQGRFFRVLWWDPDHLVCPSKKRHT